jgi:hypothetical protein
MHDENRRARCWCRSEWNSEKHLLLASIRVIRGQNDSSLRYLLFNPDLQGVALQNLLAGLCGSGLKWGRENSFRYRSDACSGNRITAIGAGCREIEKEKHAGSGDRYQRQNHRRSSDIDINQCLRHARGQGIQSDPGNKDHRQRTTRAIKRARHWNECCRCAGARRRDRRQHRRENSEAMTRASPASYPLSVNRY